MIHNRLLIVSVLSIGVMFLSRASGQQTDSIVAPVLPGNPLGPIVIEEDVWFHFIDEPSQYMHDAHESLLKKEYNLAAAWLAERFDADFRHFDWDSAAFYRNYLFDGRLSNSTAKGITITTVNGGCRRLCIVF